MNMESAQNKLSDWLEPSLALKTNQHINLKKADIVEKDDSSADSTEDWDEDWDILARVDLSDEETPREESTASDYDYDDEESDEFGLGALAAHKTSTSDDDDDDFEDVEEGFSIAW